MAWCGKNITVLLVRNNDGEQVLLYFGKNRRGYGQLTTMQMPVLRTPLPLLTSSGRVNAVQVAFGESHVAVLTACKRLYMAGSNSYGQIGRGPKRRWNMASKDRLEFYNSQPHGMVESVACGHHHTLVVVGSGADATVWGCGANHEQQLQGRARLYALWRQLDIGAVKALQTTPGTVRVAAGWKHSVVAVGDAVATMGVGAQLGGDLPLNTTGSGVDYHVVAGAWKMYAELPWQGTPIKHMVSGSEHVLVACVMHRRLQVYGWGDNTFGQLWHHQGTMANNTITMPRELPFDCPEQNSNTFSSMLAAYGNTSTKIMVGGHVWAHNDTTENSMYEQIDQTLFAGLHINFVSVGDQHVAYVSACGKLFMQGKHHNDTDNGIPTAWRVLKCRIAGICEKVALAKPTLLPAVLMHGLPVYTSLPLAHKIAFLMPSVSRLRRAGCVIDLVEPMILKMILDFAEEFMPRVHM